jgi:hypothetical protein
MRPIMYYRVLGFTNLKVAVYSNLDSVTIDDDLFW